MRPPLTVATAQIACVPGDIEANIARHLPLLAEAARAGAQVVLFTELSLVGYELELIARDLPELAVTEADPRLDALRTACVEYGVHAIVGAVTPTATGYALSSLVFDDRGELIASYAKHHLHGREIELFEPGSAHPIVEIAEWPLGLAICADLNYPEHARVTVAAGAVVYLASALYTTGAEDRRDNHLRAAAFENNCWTVLSAYAGQCELGPTTGGSGIWNPGGILLGRAGTDTPALITATLT
ncbi:carbon-nitrogen hydrolase family protein [Nocardia sp. SYP-A9097]|uniref:carbon-nitrogen hydrolase family protein n=1 Tax=Nocardia sp. SYP-A9097 TaxID=2663237 RepID=UPI001890D357|nr:carbon-nitrogen hydrolase family protein [Nocardia sp. SYP-A9097]